MAMPGIQSQPLTEFCFYLVIVTVYSRYFSCGGFDCNGLALHLFFFAVEAIVYRGVVASLSLLVMLRLVQHGRGAKTIFLLPISCCICAFQLPVPTCLPLMFDH